MDSGHNASNGGNAQGIYSGADGSAGQPIVSNAAGAPVQPVQQPVVSSGYGDIILAPSNGGGKKRRWPLVVAILLIVVAICSAVLAVIVSSRTTPVAECIKSFNTLSNYMLDGSDSSESPSKKIDDYMMYKIILIDEASDSNVEYLKNVKELARAVKNVCDDSNLEQQMKDRIDNYSDIVEAYVETSLLDYTMAVVASGVESGNSDAVLADIKKGYRDLVLSQSQEVTIIGNKLIEGMDYYANYVDVVIKETSCTIGSTLDDCSDDISDIEEDNEDLDNAVLLFNDAIGSVNFQIRLAIPQGWAILNSLEEIDS